MKQEAPIAERLSDFLNRRDMTLTQAAKITGLSIGTFSKIIMGRVCPNRRTAYKLEQLIAGKNAVKSKRGTE